MKNLNKFYNYLKKEDVSAKELTNYLRKYNVRVNTIICRKWEGKPYLCYNEECKEWFMFLSHKDTRRIKMLMSVAKSRIKLEMPNVRCMFKVDNYEHFVK